MLCFNGSLYGKIFFLIIRNLNKLTINSVVLFILNRSIPEKKTYECRHSEVKESITINIHKVSLCVFQCLEQVTSSAEALTC